MKKSIATLLSILMLASVATVSVFANEATADDPALEEEETTVEEDETIAEEDETVAEETEATTDDTDKNQPTGVALALVPVAIAGVTTLVARKRK